MKKNDPTPKKDSLQKVKSSCHDTSADLKAVEAAALDEFVRTMNEEVIPEIVRVVHKRRLLAAQSRHWQLKC